MLVPESLPRQFSNKRKLFITSDEHYFHKNIIKYQNRPFDNLEVMNRALINNHNSVVGKDDHVIHIGDFSFGHKEEFCRVIRELNGHHYVMDGSHDKALAEYEEWGEKPTDVQMKLTVLPKLFEFTYNGMKVVLCHYAMMTWWASHYNKGEMASYHFFGHSHGRLTHPEGAIDIGVDTNNFYPYRIDDAMAILDKKIKNS
jgi:calcineurin-like phosphoesterase family protein